LTTPGITTSESILSQIKPADSADEADYEHRFAEHEHAIGTEDTSENMGCNADPRLS